MAQSFDIASLDTIEKAAAFIETVWVEKQAISAQGAMIGGGLGLGAAGLQALLNKNKRKHWLRNALLYGGVGAGLGSVTPTAMQWLQEAAQSGSPEANKAKKLDKLQGAQNAANKKQIWQANNPDQVHPSDMNVEQQVDAGVKGTPGRALRGAAIGGSAGWAGDALHNTFPSGKRILAEMKSYPDELGQITSDRLKSEVPKSQIHPSLTKTTESSPPFMKPKGWTPKKTTSLVEDPAALIKNDVATTHKPGDYNRFTRKGNIAAKTTVPPSVVSNYADSAGRAKGLTAKMPHSKMLGKLRPGRRAGLGAAVGAATDYWLLPALKRTMAARGQGSRVIGDRPQAWSPFAPNQTNPMYGPTNGTIPEATNWGGGRDMNKLLKNGL